MLKENVDEFLEELLRSGILTEDGSGIHEEVKFGKKADVANFLTSHDIKFLKSAKKSDLETICLAEIPEETKKHFGTIRSYNVLIPNRFNRRSIHYYLHRKYDESEFIDEDVRPIPLLKTWLPEDRVTDELIKRGYYSRDGIVKPDECCGIKIILGCSDS